MGLEDEESIEEDLTHRGQLREPRRHPSAEPEEEVDVGQAERLLTQGLAQEPDQRIPKVLARAAWRPKSGKGLPEPVLYSERIWARNIGKASRALTALDKTQREVVLSFVERVRKYQGTPEGLVRMEAMKNGTEHLLDLAVGVGLVNRTRIQMADGSSRSFLTSPHFFVDLEAEFGEDMCDRIKIFLDSIRNGQHYGHLATGRIVNPDALLRKLLNSGVIGPCTAIGTDWVTSEKAGIIRVRREDVKSGKCYMELVQGDTVSKVHDLITTGTVAPSESTMEPSHVREGVNFQSIEEGRVEAGEVPEPIAEAERAIILTLRES